MTKEQKVELLSAITKEVGRLIEAIPETAEVRGMNFAAPSEAQQVVAPLVPGKVTLAKPLLQDEAEQISEVAPEVPTGALEQEIVQAPIAPPITPPTTPGVPPVPPAGVLPSGSSLM